PTGPLARETEARLTRAARREAESSGIVAKTDPPEHHFAADARPRPGRRSRPPKNHRRARPGDRTAWIPGHLLRQLWRWYGPLPLHCPRDNDDSFRNRDR